MLCSATYRYNGHHFLDAVPKISVKFSGRYFSDTLLAFRLFLLDARNAFFSNDCRKVNYTLNAVRLINAIINTLIYCSPNCGIIKS